MTKDDYPEFVSAWRSAIAIYGKDIDESTCATLFALLMSYSLDDITGALDSHLCDPDAGRFQPKPADIVRNIQRDNNAVASYAFDQILKQLNPYATPEFDDPRAAGAVCAIGGWQALCRINNNEIERTKARFIEAYNDGVKPRATLLKGLVEIDNEERILPRKPELLERFPHPVRKITTRTNSTKEIGNG